MTENKRFELTYFDCDYITDHSSNVDYPVVDKKSMFKVVDLLNELSDENEQLKHDATVIICSNQEYRKENEQLKKDLKDCKKLKGKRLNKIRNHRAVIEDLGGSIRAYKGQISQLNEKIEKIQEAMEDTGALTKGQLERILNDKN